MSCLVWKSPEILNNSCLKEYFTYLCHANKTPLHFINHSSVSLPQGWFGEVHLLTLMAFFIIKPDSSSDRERVLCLWFFSCERHMRGKGIYNVLISTQRWFCHILDLTKKRSLMWPGDYKNVTGWRLQKHWNNNGPRGKGDL